MKILRCGSEIREIKMSQNKVSRAKREIKCREKKTLKNSFVRKKCYKNAFFMFCFPKT